MIDITNELLMGIGQGVVAAALYAGLFYLKKREGGQRFNPHKAAATLVVGAGVGGLLAYNGVTVTPGRLESALAGYIGTIAMVETALKWGYRRVRRYQRTGEVSLSLVTAPWDLLRAGYRRLRGEHFTKERPTGRHLKVNVSPEELESVPGRRGFAPNWEFSYDKGATVNLAQVVKDSVEAHPGISWWQTHVRAWPAEDGEGLLLRAHWEPEPTETDTAHLKGKGFDVDQGMENLAAVLSSAGIEYEEVDYAG